ncbi:hypothetical protein J1614_005303 [Plenodomus biglobosus]|nr:hypothetical protein J1614_005303 [Plenodomus biglobosus]
MDRKSTASSGTDLQLKRTSTIQNLFGSCEPFKSEAASARSVAATRIRDLTTRGSDGMRNLLKKGQRNRDLQSEIPISPSSMAMVDHGHGQPQITSLAKTFVDAMTFEKLSNFLA